MNSTDLCGKPVAVGGSRERGGVAAATGLPRSSGWSRCSTEA